MASSLRSLTTLRSAPSILRQASSAPRPPTAAYYHATTRLQLPYKDDQDRQSLKPRSNEGTKSGSDDAAAQTDTAFDPSTTNPEAEKESASKEASRGKGDDPLHSSGANHEHSTAAGQAGAGEMKESIRSEGKGKSSGAGEQKKAGSPKGL